MAILVDDGRLANRSFLISPEGDIAARYDKIHMFDVDLGGGEATAKPQLSAWKPRRDRGSALGKAGADICYDLRFPISIARLPGLARGLAIPSAFTRPTGMAHWHTLLRARAIESQAYVFAAAQGGSHENGRETFGHTLVVSPWGELLAEGGVHPAVIVADVELQLLEDVRRRVPSLQHDRAFDVVHAAEDVQDKVVP